MLRALREALGGFARARATTFFAVAATCCSLLVLGCFVLALLNLGSLIRYLENKVEVVVYLRDDADQGLVGMAVEDLARLEGVAEVRLISKEEALEAFREDLGADSDLLQDLEINPIPASLDITLLPGYRDTVHVRQVADVAAGLAFVEEVDYGREWIGRIDVLRGVVATVGGVAGTLLALAAVVLIASAIRIAIFNRGREIFIMKLVGATHMAIRGSFLLEGLLKGLLGGLLAAGMILVATELLRRQGLPITGFGPPHYAGTVLAGALLGLVGSWLSLSRYLRRV